jgi:hypothetical protein
MPSQRTSCFSVDSAEGSLTTASTPSASTHPSDSKDSLQTAPPPGFKLSRYQFYRDAEDKNPTCLPQFHPEWLLTTHPLLPLIYSTSDFLPHSVLNCISPVLCLPHFIHIMQKVLGDMFSRSSYSPRINASQSAAVSRSRVSRSIISSCLPVHPLSLSVGSRPTSLALLT